MLLMLVLLAGLLSGCTTRGDGDGLGTAARQGEGTGTLLMAPCVLKGSPHPAECGQLPVPRDHGDADSTTLALRVARIRARGSTPQADPLFLLAGGPGQAASEAFAPLLPALSGVLRDRDVVMVDQRGTGASAPLDCELSDELAELLKVGTLPDVARRCAARHNAGGKLRPEYYSTQQAADDVDAVRRALGYARINLLGVSYGTRLAMRYAVRHPKATRSLVLDGVAPEELLIPLSFARDAQDALDAVMARCADQPGCAKAFPDLPGKLTATLQRLEATPAELEVRHPRTAERVKLTLSRRAFAEGLRGLMYSPELVALLPLVIAEAHEGRFDAFVAQMALLAEGSREEGSTGLTLTILCNEDLARLDPKKLAEAARGTFLGADMGDEMLAACAVWPRGAMPAIEAGWRSEVPALAMSGQLDPVTPPRWAETALKHLPQGQSLVVQGAAHGVLARGCVPRLVKDFLAAPDDQLDSNCVKDFAPPAFFIDHAGPDMAASTAPASSTAPAAEKTP